MKKDTDRTIDEYKLAGSQMRLIKTLGSRLAVNVSRVLPAAESDKLLRALRKIDGVCSKAEDRMFHDHPELSNDYLSVFYGAINNTPRNSLDEEMIERARQVADELFE